MIRSNIQFMNIDEHPPKSIMITSANPSEGKSISAANLGISMAQADFRTIIVDADLRRPTMHEIFELPNSSGLADLLGSSAFGITNYLNQTAIENLQIITSGPPPQNPSERLSSQRLVKLLEQLEHMADIIIFDSPPVLSVTDAAVLANRIEGVVLVIQAKRTTRAMAKRALERLNQVGANLLGGILNQLPGSGNVYQSYYAPAHKQVTVTSSNEYPSPPQRSPSR